MYSYMIMFILLPSPWKNFPLIFVFILLSLIPSIAPDPPSYSLLSFLLPVTMFKKAFRVSL